MRVDVVTIFPDFLTPLTLSLVGKARTTGLLDLRVHDLRDWTSDRHRSVDDTPYGGGAGMVMRPEPWALALESIAADRPDQPPPRLIVPSPAGIPFRQSLAAELATEPWLAVACGRYEGIDQRVLDHARTWLQVDEVSVGDYVLAGGESAAIVMIEAVVRLLPGVLGNPASLVEESYADALLEYPVYTKPASWRGAEVPGVLLSGHHGEVARWRRDAALRRTAQRRPDLVLELEPKALSPRDLRVLSECGFEPGPIGAFHRVPPPVAD